jgi:hypothetical protein
MAIEKILNLCTCVFGTDHGEVSSFSLNGAAHNVTVNETEHVEMSCTVIGRPTPAVRIVKDGGYDVITRPMGSEVTEQDVVTLTPAPMTSAQCVDAGRYTCHVGQDDSGDSSTRWLFVNCKPVFFKFMYIDHEII